MTRCHDCRRPAIVTCDACATPACPEHATTAPCPGCGRPWWAETPLGRADALCLSCTRPMPRRHVGAHWRARCGTDAGYGLHLRQHETACEACLAAHRAAERVRAAARKRLETAQRTRHARVPGLPLEWEQLRLPFAPIAYAMQRAGVGMNDLARKYAERFEVSETAAARRLGRYRKAGMLQIAEAHRVCTLIDSHVDLVFGRAS